jgi:hypothetical protein
LKILFFLLVFSIAASFAQMPRPDHVVIVMFENKGYSQIVDSPEAPYFNSLIADTNTALFTQYFALTHPSQPNYLILYSGGDQGVKTDNIPTNTPFSTCNLGASLRSKGYTFAGYSESMPSVGYLGNQTSLYYRRHNPWSDWQGSGTNSVPASANQPYTAFPSGYDSLPDVSFVIPNIINCMHNGSVAQGDTWLQTNLNAYRQWALNNNSLLIITFDEDNGDEENNIFTCFYGPMIKGGTYNTHVDHYDLLRTLEDIYALPLCEGSAAASAMDFAWKNFVGIEQHERAIETIKIFPNPNAGEFSIKIPELNESANIEICDMLGRKIFTKRTELKETKINLKVEKGIYWLNIERESGRENFKLVVGQ